MAIYDLYFLLYITMISFTFIGLPFSYFYAQSVQDEEYMQTETPFKSGKSNSKFGLRGMDSSDSDEEENEDDDDMEFD